MPISKVVVLTLLHSECVSKGRAAETFTFYTSHAVHCKNMRCPETFLHLDSMKPSQRKLNIREVCEEHRHMLGSKEPVTERTKRNNVFWMRTKGFH